MSVQWQVPARALNNMPLTQRNIDLAFVVRKFKSGVLARCMLVHVESERPSISVSVYEANYAKSSDRYKGTINTVLHHVAYLFTWAEKNLTDLEARLLGGYGLNLIDIKRFSGWLEKNIQSNAEGVQIPSYPRKIMSSCKDFVIWFVWSFAPITAKELGANYDIHELIKAHKLCWIRNMSGSDSDPIAPDITDTQLGTADSYLKTRMVGSDDEVSCGIRNYLIYRLVKAFGLRIGEALALRLSDISLSGSNPSIEIKRIDERGAAYEDPRSPYHPKVKTRSRLLYFDPRDKDLLSLLEVYISVHRVQKKIVGERKVLSIFLAHDFLFIEHGVGNAARPLSCSAATRIASSISQAVGFKFHWHLLRHSTFNRLYEAASKIKNNSTEIDHLVYMGGWSSPESLRLYARRAIRENALRKLSEINRVGVLNEY